MSAMLSKHHAAWLMAHPDRSSHWLKARLGDGFEVHHVDCNHENDDPDNLVLIEADDHRKLHGRPVAKPVHQQSKRRAPSERRARLGNLAYEKRREGFSWWKTALALDLPSETDASMAAWEYARVNGLQWPPISNERAKELRRIARYGEPSPEA